MKCILSIFLIFSYCNFCFAQVGAGLIACYPFNGNANDYSGYGNHGTIVGAVTPTADRFGNPNGAFHFSTNNYITIPTSQSLESPDSALTIATWIKIDNGNNGAIILCKSNLNNLDPFQYRFFVGGQMQMTFGYKNSPTTYTDLYSVQNFVGTNSWVHVAITFDGQMVRFYKNGNLMDSVNQVGTIFVDGKPLEIGRDAHGGNDWLIGDLDDIKIYNTALSSSEIFQLYANSASCSPGGCQTYQVLFNSGRNPISGSIIPYGQQDTFWKVTSIQNTTAMPGYNIPYSPFVIQQIGPNWWTPTNSRYLNIIDTSLDNGGPLDTHIELTRHFTTIAADSYKVKAYFSVDNFVEYFKIDGINYFTSINYNNAQNYQLQNLAINDTIIFLNPGCHDITVSYGNYYGGNMAGNPVGINIEGYIQSKTGDTTLLSEDCYLNIPPVLSGNNVFNYCNDCEPISPNLTITSGTGCGNIDTAKIYFTQGYLQGNDTLIFNPILGINSFFNVSTGVLTLYGNANYSVWETVLRTVCYSNLGGNIIGSQKQVTIVLGNLLFNPANGHYYKLVNNPPSVNWSDAKVKSSQSHFFGLQGYLVTITSQQEDNFISSFYTETVWIGASDSAVEGEWRWVSGCEGLEESGQGRLFWLGDQNGNPVNGNYTNWNGLNGGNPSNTNNEDVASKLYPYNGEWNDANWNTPYGYIIEYGCMPNDPVINLAANITINLLQGSTSTFAQTICQGQTYFGYDSTGVFIDTFTNQYGCDSIRTLNLTVIPFPTTTLTQSICQGQSYLGYTISGTYIDTFTSINGCDSIVTLNLTVNPLPSVGSTPANAGVCPGASVTLSGTGANTYTWSGGITNGVPFSPPVTTTYTVTGTDLNNCSNTATKTVTVFQPPTINITAIPANGIACAGDSVTLTASGANTIVWTGGVSNGIPFMPGVGNTTYTVTGTDANGCTGTNSVSITVNPLPIITINPLNPAICIGDSINLIASGAVNYNWSPIAGLNPNTGANVIANPLTTTTYTVSGIDANGCSNTNTKTVMVNPLPVIVINPTNPVAICSLANVTLTATGANTYTWSGGITNGVPFSPPATTTYTVTGTDINGCSNTATKTVTVYPLPSIAITSTPANGIVCAGDSVTLTASGANTIVWTGGVSNGIPFVPGVGNTTYTVTGTDANGCTATSSISILVNPLPIITINPLNPSICIGDSINLIAGGAINYNWSPIAGLNPITGANVIANPLTTTTYTVSGVDANGCSNTNSKTVMVNLLPVIVINPANPVAICSLDNVTLTASGANIYTWSGGITNGVPFSPAATTTFTVTGTDINGCTNTAIKTVTVYPLPVLNVTPNNSTLCAGDNVQLVATGANVYNWLPLAGLTIVNFNTVDAAPLATTTYTVTGTDNNNCSNTATALVTVNPLPNVNILPSNPSICFGDTVSLNAYNANTYQWSPPIGLNQTFGPTVIANPNATQTYTLTGTDANNCSNTTSVTVAVNPLPALTVNPVNPAICLGDTVAMLAGGAANYQWSPPTGLNATNVPNVIATPNTTTLYKIIGTTGFGCTDSIYNTVTVNLLPIVAVSPAQDSLCQGDSIGLTASGAATYLWTPGASLNINTGSNVIATPFATTIYTVTGEDANNCVNTATASLTVFPTYVHADSVELCEGTSYPFGNQTITTTGNYSHTFQTQYSCDSTVNLKAIFYPKPVAGFMIDHDICVGESISIQNIWQAPNATYTWTAGDGIFINNQPAINVVWNTMGSKIITIDVATQHPCQPAHFEDTLFVHQAYAKVKVAGNDSTFCIYDYVRVETPNFENYSYHWLPSHYFNSKLNYAESIVKEPIDVIVQVKDEWGCEAQDTLFLNVEPCCNAYLPNAFSPNGDGVNDVFRIIGEGNYHILDFYVANRWGNIIFKTIDPNKGWDGTYKGTYQNLDTYYYYLKYECANGDKHVMKGDLLLIR